MDLIDRIGLTPEMFQGAESLAAHIEADDIRKPQLHVVIENAYKSIWGGCGEESCKHRNTDTFPLKYRSKSMEDCPPRRVGDTQFNRFMKRVPKVTTVFKQFEHRVISMHPRQSAGDREPVSSALTSGSHHRSGPSRNAYWASSIPVSQPISPVMRRDDSAGR